MPDDKSIKSEAQYLVRRWTIGFNVCLTLVVVPPVIGLVGTVLAMIRAFETLGPSGEAGDPSLIAEAIGEALMSTAMGIKVSLAALIILVITTIGRARAKRRLSSLG